MPADLTVYTLPDPRLEKGITIGSGTKPWALIGEKIKLINLGGKVDRVAKLLEALPDEDIPNLLSFGDVNFDIHPNNIRWFDVGIGWARESVKAAGYQPVRGAFQTAMTALAGNGFLFPGKNLVIQIDGMMASPKPPRDLLLRLKLF